MRAELLGQLLLLLGCASLGVLRGLELKKRTACLWAFRRALSLLTRELSFSLRPLTDLLDQAAGETTGPAGTFFTACRENFLAGGGESWADSWQQALAETPLPLTEPDKQVLAQVGDVLGRYDGESQRRALEGLGEALDGCLDQSRQEEKRLFRVYVALGVTGGLFCLILL